MESALRPRDIQARIRAGETPEDVAAAAQTSVEAIMAFADPVMAERAHVARTAQKASVRRRAEGAGTARTLGDAAAVFFASRSLHDEDVTWDAWRQADGRWALVADYAVEGHPRRAEFTHDLPGKYVVAENDEARMLTGEVRDPAAADRSPERQRRLSAVPTDELPLGDDAIELVREKEPVVEPVDEQPQLVEEPHEEPREDVVAETVEAPEEEEPELDEPAAEEPPADEKPQKPRAKRKARSSVPSWDEIMFGGGPGGQ